MMQLKLHTKHQNTEYSNNPTKGQPLGATKRLTGISNQSSRYIINISNNTSKHQHIINCTSHHITSSAINIKPYLPLQIPQSNTHWNTTFQTEIEGHASTCLPAAH
jgi:hypothetical protein